VPQVTAGRLSEDLLRRLDEALRPVDAALAQRYSGGDGSRQPVHTVYVPADVASPATPASWGRRALDLLGSHAGSPEELARVTGMDDAVVADAYPLLLAKLADQPVEDLRLDLEDGYGAHPDAEEDAAALAAGATLAALPTQPAAPVLAGVRVRSMEGLTRRRGLRSLDLVLSGLCAAAQDGAPPPQRFVVTLAKVSVPAQASAFAQACSQLESAYGLPPGWVGVELQIEVPAAVVAADGTAALAAMVGAADGRCTGLHFGTYDFNAACGVPAALQSLEHPLADHAKAVMCLAAAGTGVQVSDGSTNVLPEGDRQQVHAAWRLHTRLVRRALERGLPQGWDLHPGHLVTRHLVTLAFYRELAPASVARLRDYVAGAGDAGVLDEPATAQAMATTLTRGIACGALDEAQVCADAGVTPQWLAAMAGRRVA